MSKQKKDDKKSKSKTAQGSSDLPTPGSAAPSPDQKVDTFKSYSLEGVPEEAWPILDQVYKGKHSYTVAIQGAVPRFH